MLRHFPGIILAAALIIIPLTTLYATAKLPPGKLPDSPPEGLAYATFAGGCFWCMEPPFDRTPGVLETISGYTGGHTEHPSYEQVSAGGTGHYEALRVVFDPRQVSYDTLLTIFWSNIDPYDASGQFCDRGDQYRSAVFWHDDGQKEAALRSVAHGLQDGSLDKAPATEILPAQDFWQAEDYHQDYYRKNPVRYKFYRFSCGRDQRLEELHDKR
ncbi:peptide methionine sulfoxide reductase [Oleidesulfovibrio alaskensis G20]|uniref:Peptide methionine sulfoxide reductase MsrA n=1 Tax=Oleidesulfovibrio alaskensis (strain ATCC BAA-1058 / DSM 17464 / G20) TaxID=207559 RepID=Q30YG7_OLEA2|nr:peptide-methionine (S)-S-oxide reductase MsrA [Oleidesulfovibrio alaskensis]ABB39279.1 peptide methionine sulfoxide reductase [Oleidesulfovibrio alaskensis G20]MBG0771971.1 peptide-methionine (S)-S-oxide reductase MsrA [Oleidesulfovibrio alaskensis]